MHICTQERLILNRIGWMGWIVRDSAIILKKSGWMCHHLEIYIGRPIVTDVSCSHLKFIFYEFIHFALPKCRLNLDQHEYKLLQLSSSASQYDTWVMGQYAFHTPNMYQCHPWDTKVYWHIWENLYSLKTESTTWWNCGTFFSSDCEGLLLGKTWSGMSPQNKDLHYDGVVMILFLQLPNYQKSDFKRSS